MWEPRPLPIAAGGSDHGTRDVSAAHGREQLPNLFFHLPGVLDRLQDPAAEFDRVALAELLGRLLDGVLGQAELVPNGPVFFGLRVAPRATCRPVEQGGRPTRSYSARTAAAVPSNSVGARDCVRNASRRRLRPPARGRTARPRRRSRAGLAGPPRPAWPRWTAGAGPPGSSGSSR